MSATQTNDVKGDPEVGLKLEDGTLQSDLGVACNVTIHLLDKDHVYTIDAKQAAKSLFGKFTKLEINYQGHNDHAASNPPVPYVWPKDFTAEVASIARIAMDSDQVTVSFTDADGNPDKVTLIAEGTVGSQAPTDDPIGLKLEDNTIVSELAVGCKVTIELLKKPLVYKIDANKAIKSIFGVFTQLELDHQRSPDSSEAKEGPVYVWPKSFTAKVGSIVKIAMDGDQITVSFTDADDNPDVVTLIEQDKRGAAKNVNASPGVFLVQDSIYNKTGAPTTVTVQVGGNNQQFNLGIDGRMGALNGVFWRATWGGVPYGFRQSYQLDANQVVTLTRAGDPISASFPDRAHPGRTMTVNLFPL